MKISAQSNINLSYNSSNSSVKKQYFDKGNIDYVQFSKTASDAIKNNTVSLINFGRNFQTKKIEEIVSLLKEEYKIDAQFSNLEIAKLTLEAVEDFVKLNDKNIFEGLIIKDCELDDGGPWETRGNYNDMFFAIKLNNTESVDNLRSTAQDEYDDCLISSNNPKYYLYECLGEFLCFKHNPYAYTLNSKKNNFSDSTLQIARKLGERATLNFERFNSSYIASKMSKVEIPKKADDFYEEFSGADINFAQAEIKSEARGIEHSFNNTDEAIEYLKEKYNIEAEFENLTIANLAVGAIEDFIKINENEHLFDGLVIKKQIDNTSVYGGMKYKYNYATGQLKSCVYFNLAYDWKRHDKLVKKDYNLGYHPSDNPKLTFYHELAHWLDLHNNPEDYISTCDKFNSGKVYINDLGKKVFGKVSGYAQESPIEFKAEYISAKMCGLSFPKLVDEFFKQDYIVKNIPLKFPESLSD